MKLFVVALLVGVCAAGRLEHTYLPPSSAQSAGGDDQYLSAPGGQSNVYLPPQQQYQGPSQYTAAKPAARQYLPPQQQYSAPRSAARQYLPPQQQTQRSQYSAPRRSQYSAPRPAARQYLPPQQQYQSPQYSAPRPAARQYLPPQQQSYQSSLNYGASKSASRQYLPPSASAYSQGPATPPTPILKYENQPNAGDGAYNFEYETGNGIMQNEHGHQAGQEEEVVEGSYSYTADDGAQYTVQYKADANGFQAYGDHLPTPPAIPEAIQRSLEINAAAEAARQAQGYQYNAPQGTSAQSRTYLPPQAGRNGNGGYQY